MRKYIKKGAALLLALLLLTVSVFAEGIPATALPDDASSAGKKLILGGTTFGVRLYREGITVVGIKEGALPEDESGIRVGDVIKEANGKRVNSSEDLAEAIRGSGGETVTLLLERDGSTLTIEARPHLKDGEYVLGIWARNGVAGIGTVTYTDPDTGEFGGLGHGICDSAGKPIPFCYGDTEEVKINETIKGTPGTPGELRGVLGEKTGKITANNESGVFGVFVSIPKDGRLCEVAPARDVREGEITIVCSFEDGVPQEYGAEIVRITDRKAPGKNFLIRVTDERLIEKTGGIVQGMSGSPILQGGRLIGAVTHVIVSDPTYGYGIFIGNMRSGNGGE